ncbi:helix-turn-helix domain-containing protein [Hydrogenophaga sp.]|uniref:helix-turn-helix domain-containing protein n=1 Tax=Hydrogenophaga sp. TaxID=1904254 RepID=UPI0035ADA9AB
MTEMTASDQAFSRPVLLRQARENAGLHIAVLAAALKVPVKKLEALEDGRYDDLPDLTFARALASSACRHLKIDPVAVLQQIPQGPQPTLGVVPNAINAPFKPAQDGGQSLSSAEWLRKPAVLVSLVLVLGALGLMFMPDWLPGDSSPKAEPVVSSEAAPSSPATEPKPVEPVAERVAEPAAQPVPTPETPAAGAVPAAPVPAPEAVSAAAAGAASLLSIKATGDSWVEVVDGAGKSQVQRMLRTGDVLDFSATPPYAVVIGRADAVAVTVRGQAFDVMPYARNSVARFQVK